jgi:PAS domain S-box-containing protein
LPLVTLSIDQLGQWLRDGSIQCWTLAADGTGKEIQSWTLLTGQTREQATGGGWLDCIHVDDRDRIGAAWRTAMAHGQAYNTDARICTREGIYRWFNLRAAPQRARDGEIVGWIGLTLEIAGLARFRQDPVEIEHRDAVNAGVLPPSIVRAARAMTNWSAEELATRSGVSVSTIRRLERDGSEVQARRTSTDKLLRAYADAGLAFVDGNGMINGVRWAQADD